MRVLKPVLGASIPEVLVLKPYDCCEFGDKHYHNRVGAPMLISLTAATHLTKTWFDATVPSMNTKPIRKKPWPLLCHMISKMARSGPKVVGISLPMWGAFGLWAALGAPAILALQSFFGAIGEMLEERDFE